MRTLFFSSEEGLTVRRMPTDEVPYAVFEGVVPTAAQVDQIDAAGYGVHVLASPTPDLGFLRAFGNLTHLSVTGVSLDTRVVGELVGLQRLDVMVAKSSGADLSGLERLRVFDGTLEGFESVFDAPNVQVVAFHEVSSTELRPIPRQLLSLSLYGARRVSSIRPVSEHSDLRTFVIDRSQRFDAFSLERFPSLESVSLMKVAAIVGTTSLTRLPVLRALGLINCRSVDDVEALRELRGVEVTIVGPLGETFREIARAADRPWTILRRL